MEITNKLTEEQCLHDKMLEHRQTTISFVSSFIITERTHDANLTPIYSIIVFEHYTLAVYLTETFSKSLFVFLFCK